VGRHDDPLLHPVYLLFQGSTQEYVDEYFCHFLFVHNPQWLCRAIVQGQLAIWGYSLAYLFIITIISEIHHLGKHFLYVSLYHGILDQATQSSAKSPYE